MGIGTGTPPHPCCRFAYHALLRFQQQCYGTGRSRGKSGSRARSVGLERAWTSTLSGHFSFSAAHSAASACRPPCLRNNPNHRKVLHHPPPPPRPVRPTDWAMSVPSATAARCAADTPDSAERGLTPSASRNGKAQYHPTWKGSVHHIDQFRPKSRAAPYRSAYAHLSTRHTSTLNNLHLNI